MDSKVGSPYEDWLFDMQVWISCSHFPHELSLTLYG